MSNIVPVSEHMTTCIVGHLLGDPAERPAWDAEWAMKEFKKGKKKALFSESQIERIEAAVRERAAGNGEAVQLQLF